MILCFKNFFIGACPYCFKPINRETYNNFKLNFKDSIKLIRKFQARDFVLPFPLLCSKCFHLLKFRQGSNRFFCKDGLITISAFYYNDILANLVRRYKFKQEPKLSILFFLYAYPVWKSALAEFNTLDFYSNSEDTYIIYPTNPYFKIDKSFNFEQRYFSKSEEVLYSKINNFNLKKFKTLIPIPLHKNRLNERGYNQAYLLAELFSKDKNFFLLDQVLVRTKNTNRQTELNSVLTRKENLKGAFSVKDNLLFYEKLLLKKTTIILLDDIYTSGETLLSAYKALKQAGFSNIISLCLASGRAENLREWTK